MRALRNSLLALLLACSLATPAIPQTNLNPAAASAAGGLYNQIMSATPTMASTGLSAWLNQGSATTANSATGLQITGVSGQLWQLLSKASPTPPYSITAEVECFYSGNG